MQDPTEFRKRFLLYKEGKMPYENGLPKYKNGTGGDVPAYQRFVEEMGPVLFGQIVAQGVKNPEKAYRNMITQLAYESNYGTSSVARNLNNYGGVGWNGKTYTTYKDKADFAKNYVRLMNSRYKNVIAADTLLDYAKGLKGLGYYEDSLENYSRNLTGMKSFAKALDSHIANNPDLYTVVSGKPMSQTTAAELHAASLFEPAPVVIHSDYSLNNPAPSTISSWNNPTSPAFNTSGLYARRAINNINNVVQDILFNDKDVSDALKDNLSKNVFGGKRLGFKNGKLPRYKDGTPTKVGEYNVYPSAIGASELNVTVPEVTVTGIDRRPMYQRYDAENSTYDPEVIRNLTDWAPVVGDIGQGLDAYNAFKNKDYLQAGVLGGMLLLPNALEKPGKALLKAGLKYAPNITKNVYDISKLYTKIEDNPRLRRYANDVADLLNSNQISERVAKSIDDVDIAKLISNISNTPIAFSHSNKLWIRPMITLEPLGLNYKFRSPIPIQMRAAGFYDPAGKKTFIKRNGRTPEQIKLTTYHETSHASDNASPKDVGIGFYDRNTHVEGKNAYFDLATEKRARLMSILTDAYKHGVDINNKSAIEEFITSPNYTNHNLNSLLKDYNYIFDKADDFYDLLDNGFKDGKLPMFKNGKSPIHIKPANRGKFTALKKRTGHSASWFKENGTPAQKKMAVFALNAKKWKH